jgi:glycine cleavage system H protein
MKIGKYEFPDDLFYDTTHNWARVEGDEVVQGMSAFGQALAGEIVYVEPPVLNRNVKQGEPMFSIESGKWVGRINATVSGELVAFNQELEWEPALVNREPYGQGWMVRLRPANLEEDPSRLLRPGTDEFRSFIAAEQKKYNL